MMHFYQILSLTILGLAGVSCYLTPKISVCKRADPDLDKCIIAVVEKIRSNVASGDFGDGVKLPSLDPAYVDRLDVDDGTNLKATFRNLTVTGAKAFKIDKLRANFPEKTLNILLTLDKMKIKGKYTMKMKISLLVIDGNGDATLDLTDVKLLFKMRYSLVKREDGRMTIRYDPIDFKIKFAGEAKFYLTNLLRGRPELEQAANDAINASPEVILDRAKPAIQKFFSDMFTAITNGLMENAEEDEAFPV